MKKRNILSIFVAIIVFGCCFAFCGCDKTNETMETYVEIKCESNDSVFYLTFAPGVDELRIEVPSSLCVYKNYLTVYDTSSNQTLIEYEAEVNCHFIDIYGRDYGVDSSYCFTSTDEYDMIPDELMAVTWEITYKKTGETRTVRLIVERC